jgi:serine phosphatase RsbU (regulator of sigma subunit)
MQFQQPDSIKSEYEQAFQIQKSLLPISTPKIPGYQSAFSTRFISLFYAEMETNGTSFYVNAGHPAPILVYNNEVTELNSTGLVFGALPEIDLRRSNLNIIPGSVLVLFSDGIVERLNTSGVEFGVELLKEVIIKNNGKMMLQE